MADKDYRIFGLLKPGELVSVLVVLGMVAAGAVAYANLTDKVELLADQHDPEKKQHPDVGGGQPPKHEWRGTKLAFEKSPGTMGEFVDLKALDGDSNKNAIDDLQNGLAELEEKLSESREQVRNLEAQLKSTLARFEARDKERTSVVKFVRVDDKAGTTLQAPGPEEVSKWNLVVVPLTLGFKPVLPTTKLDSLKGYEPPGNGEAGLVDEFQCYARQDDETHWRVFATQMLSASMLTGQTYGVDVCCIMVRK